MVQTLLNTVSTTGLVLPAYCAEDKAGVANKGVSHDSADRIAPLMHPLQSTSPICDRRSVHYQDGAEAGAIELRTNLRPIRDGVAGVVGIFCGAQKWWIEWPPERGTGGPIERHKTRPSDTVLDASGARSRMVRANGNRVEQTTETFWLIENQAYMLPLTSTGHQFYRTLNTHMLQFRYPNSDDVLPSFSRQYRVVTERRTNSLGSWFGLAFRDEGWASEAEYAAAKALNAIVEAGRARGDYQGADAAAG
jgi:hypothetical protein